MGRRKAPVGKIAKGAILIMLAGAVVAPFARAQDPGEQKASSYKQYRSKQKQMRDQQIAEDKAFRRGLHGKTLAEKRAAIKARRDARLKEKPDFTPEVHARNIRILKKAMKKIRGLSRDEKDALAYFFEDQYVRDVSFADERYADHLDFFRRAVSSPEMNVEQKKDVLRRFVTNHEADVE